MQFKIVIDSIFDYAFLFVDNEIVSYLNNFGNVLGEAYNNSLDLENLMDFLNASSEEKLSIFISTHYDCIQFDHADDSFLAFTKYAKERFDGLSPEKSIHSVEFELDSEYVRSNFKVFWE